MYPDIKTLQNILVSESYISKADADHAAQNARESIGFIDFLVREELLSRPLLGQALAEAYRLPFVDLGVEAPNVETLALVPADLARKNRIICTKADQKVVMLATDRPAGINKNEIQKLFFDKQVKLQYALPEAVEGALSQYEQPLDTRFSHIIEGGKRVAPEIVDEIIGDALTYHASDIHFEPQPHDVVVRFRVDGSLHEAGRLPLEHYENVLNRIKVESGMRIDEHFAAQDGALQFKQHERTADIRVSLVPTVTGEKIVMRVLGSYVQDYSLADIGLSAKHRTLLESAAAKPFGMILVTGPTGSGKTTTLYALLKMLHKPNVNITTIEDPVEYKLAGINQIQVRDQTQLTFARGLRSIVRQDPDVILVGEIRDKETAEIAVNAALTGHLLLSTFHANDAATAIPRLMDMGVEPFLLASTLEVVIAQRLARKLCSTCRYSVTAAQAMHGVKDSGLLAEYFRQDDRLYAAKGCQVCSFSGYNGRVALFEFIEVTPQMEDLVLKNPTSQQIAALARNQGNPAMFEDAIAKVRSGQTTLSEVTRVVELPRRKSPANE